MEVLHHLPFAAIGLCYEADTCNHYVGWEFLFFDCFKYGIGTGCVSGVYQGDVWQLFFWGYWASQDVFSKFLKGILWVDDGYPQTLSIIKALHSSQLQAYGVAKLYGLYVFDNCIKGIEFVFPAKGDMGRNQAVLHRVAGGPDGFNGTAGIFNEECELFSGGHVGGVFNRTDKSEVEVSKAEWKKQYQTAGCDDDCNIGFKVGHLCNVRVLCQ